MEASRSQPSQSAHDEATNSANQETTDLQSKALIDTLVAAQNTTKTDGQEAGSAPLTQPKGDAMLELVRRRREELKAELQQIQESTQPVTGQDNRSRVNRFFTRRLNLTQRSTSVTGGVANEDDTEEHRPEQVTIEVQGLLQRQSVSSVLSSARFRRSLENSIRRGIGRLAVADTQSTSAQGATRRSPQSQASPLQPSPLRSSTGPPPPPAAVPRPPPAASQGVPPPPPPQFISDARVPPIPLGSMLSPISERTEAPTTPLDEGGPIFTAQGLAASELLRRAHHEDFVMEISELVHRQLVSTALSEEQVRTRLENVTRSRLENIGSEASSRARDAISNLPPSRIRRNDFSHLGIQSGVMEHDELDDAVSVISATASATIPYAQTSTAVNREINSLRSSMNELTNLVKMSMNIQVDIQRSIRQEVAAAMNQHVVDQARTSATFPGFRSRSAGDTKCIICLEHQADAVLYRCGHICMCFQCAMRLKEDQSRGCPVCRAPIVDVIRAYRIETD